MDEQRLRAAVLERLQEAGYEGLDDLAKALGVEKPAAAEALDWLKARGVLKGFAAVLDYRRLDLRLTALVMVKAAGDMLPAVRDRIAQLPYFTHVYEITGEFDLVALGKFTDNESLNRALKEILALRGVRATNTSLVLSTAKETTVIDAQAAGGQLPD